MSDATRNLVIVLGDQLDPKSNAFHDFDPERDAVWMAECDGEANHVWSHKARIALFLSAMRHFRDSLRKRGITVHYCELGDRENQGTLCQQLRRDVDALRPERLVLVEPGEHRLREAFLQTAQELGKELALLEDGHFICSHDQFQAHANGRKQLRLEFFYREWRRKLNVLMEDGQPLGGKWNYDSDNRGAFSKRGPGKLPDPVAFRPDAVTKAVLDTVRVHFADHPGELDHFDWPVTRRQALKALRDFIEMRLGRFGDYQDAMWTDQPYLYHSRISAAMNLKLLNPREVIQAAEDAYRRGDAPLNAVEGFVRQVLGWREYVRGVYWMHMPEYLEMNVLKADLPLPAFYWTGETDMACLRQAIQQTLQHGYAHHIQRLMVTGLYALLLGVDPVEVHRWYLAVYVDAIEWVELPNTLGMSQFADGGILGSKPYAATGKYIQRMSNYCANCRYNPAAAVGDDACPFTVLYWDFLARHQPLLSENQRMSLQVKNLDKKDPSELAQIRARAAEIRS